MPYSPASKNRVEGTTMKLSNKLLILSAAGLIAGGLLCAQAPPGPLTPPPPDPNAPVAPPPPKKPEVQPRKNILGVWKFNKDESDDGRSKLKQSREADNSNRGNGNGGYGGPRMGGGWPGMGGGGYGGPRPQGGDISDSMGDLVNPPREMKLSQNFENDPEVILSDDREHRTTFFTDGRKLEKDKDPDNKQVTARWDDKKLVTDEKGAHGGKVSRTYELSSDGKQLIETVHLTDSKGNHPVNVQYVYDATDDSGERYSVH
jgi:hypothetical protein